MHKPMRRLSAQPLEDRAAQQCDRPDSFPGRRRKNSTWRGKAGESGGRVPERVPQRSCVRQRHQGSVFVRGWGAPASLPPPTRPATLQQLPIHRLLSCKLPPPSRSCRCFSLIKGLINTCQSNGPGWEGASALITETVSQEVFSVWEEHFRLGGMKEPSYKMKRQVVFIWAHASEFTCLISASVPTDA